MVSVTHLILRFAIVQNKFQQTNNNKINHINDNHIKFEVSLHFLGIWPTVRRAGKLEIPSSKQGGSVRHGKKMIALRTLKRTGNITNNCFRKAIRLFIGKSQTFLFALLKFTITTEKVSRILIKLAKGLWLRYECS